MLMRINQRDGFTDGDIIDFVVGALGGLDIADKSVLFIIPDHTRSVPMPALFRAATEATRGAARKADFLVALGTHAPMPEAAVFEHLGITREEREDRYKNVNIFQHEWSNPDALTQIGVLDESDLGELSDGMLAERIEVTMNKRVLDYDVVCVFGPVFPHEVVGFSGGNKYFFPGVSGPEVLHMFHWLGALITNPAINGNKDTPVRRVIDKAAAMIPVEKHCLALTVVGKECKGLFFGTPEEAWSAAADLSAETHITYVDRAYDSVLAMAPPMYDELWVAGKCMYKLEPIVADGGELIIYGPHIRHISRTHGDLIKRVGYHTRDYFLAQMDRFADIPGGILAHSTHVRGIGTYENGVEKPRVDVTLATAIPERECHAVNLGYRAPASIDPADWEGREDTGRLLVRNAGEILFRLRAPEPVGTL